MEQIKTFPYPITELTTDIVKAMWIHSTRSSIRRAGAIKEMIFKPGTAPDEEHPDVDNFPSLYYIVESITPAEYYEDAAEYNAATHAEPPLTEDQFRNLPEQSKIKTPEIKNCSIHALSSDISKYLLSKSLETEGD